MKRQFSLPFLAVFFFLTSCFTSASAQKALPHLVPVEAYLSSPPSVPAYDITVDSINMFYAATSAGVLAFNGKERYEIEGKGSLEFAVFDRFFKDARNRIWCNGYRLGFGILQEGNVVPYRHSEVIKQFDRNSLDDVYEDLDGRLHLGLTSVGYFTVSNEGVLTEQLSDAKDLNGFVIKKMADGHVFFYSRYRLNKGPIVLYYQQGDGKRKPICELQSERSHYRTSLVQYSNGDFVFSNGTRDLVTFRQDSLIAHEQFTHETNSLFIDRDDNLWIGTVGGGLVRRSRDSTEREQHFLGKTAASVAAQGMDGELWIKSDERFFYCLPFLERESFVEEAPWLDEEQLFRMVSDGERVYCGSKANKLIIIEKDTIFHVPYPDAVGLAQSVPQELASTTNIHYDPVREWLWVAKFGRLLAYDGVDWHQFNIPSLPEDLTTMVWTLTSTPDGGVVANTRHGLVYLDRNNKISFHMPDKALGMHHIVKLTSDANGQIWMATSQGLWIWDESDGFQQFNADSPKSDSLAGAMDIVAECSGAIIVQTHSKGMYAVHRNQITELRDSLGNSLRVFELINDQKGNVWGRRAPDRKLVKFTYTDGEVGVEIFDQHFSFTNDDIIEVYGLAVTNDKLFFLMKGRPYTVELNEMQYGSLRPRTIVKEAFVNYRTALKLPSYNLPMDSNTVGFNFETIFFGIEEVYYRHRLVGLSQSWLETKHPTANYTSIDPGDYQLQVEIKSESSDWQSGPTINIHIQTPFWQTWWFIGLCLLAVAGLMGGAFYLRFRILQRRAQLTIDKLMAEQRTLRSQMNPHFLFNALVSLQDVVFKNGRIEAVTNISKFATLMRKVLHQSTQDVITLAEEIEMLTLYLELESLRFDGRFTFNISLGEGIDLETRILPPMLIQPFVENAVNHGLLNRKSSGGEVRIDFSPKGTGLYCTIMDNGIGIIKASEMNAGSSHQSFSLTAIKERIALLNSQMEDHIEMNIIDRSKLGASGTRIELYLP